MEEVSHRRSKNQLLRFPVPPDDAAVSCDWTLESAGIDGPSPLDSPPLPPPRSGFAIREPPKLNPPESDDARPRVEPALAASRRSLTAVSCASNLFDGKEVSYAVNNSKWVRNISCEWIIPMIRCSQLFLAFLKKRL